MKTKKSLAFFNNYGAGHVIFMGILGAAAGFVNGFLGTGGGIVLMLALGTLSEEAVGSVRDRFATVIAVILPLSLISAAAYGENASLSLAAPYLLPGILGGICGALLLDKLSVGLVKKLFAVMVIWAGINFL